MLMDQCLTNQAKDVILVLKLGQKIKQYRRSFMIKLTLATLIFSVITVFAVEPVNARHNHHHHHHGSSHVVVQKCVSRCNRSTPIYATTTVPVTHSRQYHRHTHIHHHYHHTRHHHVRHGHHRNNHRVSTRYREWTEPHRNQRSRDSFISGNLCVVRIYHRHHNYVRVVEYHEHISQCY